MVSREGCLLPLALFDSNLVSLFGLLALTSLFFLSVFTLFWVRESLKEAHIWKGLSLLCSERYDKVCEVCQIIFKMIFYPLCTATVFWPNHQDLSSKKTSLVIWSIWCVCADLQQEDPAAPGTQTLFGLCPALLLLVVLVDTSIHNLADSLFRCGGFRIGWIDK